MTKKRRNISLDGNIVSRFFDWACEKYLNSPEAATLTEWKEWEKEQRSSHPVLFALLKDFPAWCSLHSYKIISNYHHLKSKYFKKQHYIKIDVERFIRPGIQSYHWYDSDSRILYGNFQVLVEYIEDEKAGDIIDWSSDPEHERAWDEITELYNWWLNIRQERGDAYPVAADYGLTDETLMDGGNSPERRRYMKAIDESYLIEAEWQTEDTEMLLRLITIRKWLWT